MFRTYIPNVTYFGLTNVPPTFQHVVHQDLRPLLQKYLENFDSYLDDTWIVTRNSPKESALHDYIMHNLFKLLRKNSYFLKLSKCQFKVQEMVLLGWCIGNREIRIDPTKLAGLKEWPLKLKNEKQVQQTTRMWGYI